ncbi:efflux transporter outer membrane subunit [Paraburkholderia sediminicola]|uniref:efflux transporter outer membrane subunit n=1 Tax=Paraburkholderia sediminicola TaxID=458836 RepID=UPI0038BB0AD4
MVPTIYKWSMRWILCSGCLAIAAGCSLAPKYDRPPVSGSAIPFKELQGATPSLSSDAAPLADGGTWKTAQPSESIPRGEWWTIFNDPKLNELESEAALNNQNLEAAVARVKESRAITQTVSSGLFPTVNAGFGPTREKVSPASQFQPDGTDFPSQTLWRAQANAAYEVDLFGRVADSVQASKADAQRSEALLNSVLLALQADVAQNYFNLRELDAEIDVFRRTVTLRQQALGLVQHKYREGDISELDLARARSELAIARSDEMTVQRMRAASEHSLAVLLGRAPSEFSMAASPIEPIKVSVPPGLPSSLLERRPDVAAAEQAMIAANARIGVAKSAYFPSLILTGSGGFEAATLADLFKWSSRAFLLGPLVGTALTIPLFDGGKRKGNLANSRAVYEENVALYRQQVLTAFKEVEDNLSDLRILRDQVQTQSEAVDASSRAEQLSSTQYTEGAVNYLDVIDAQRTVLRSQRAAVQLSGVQAVATVNLVRALGGGWGDAAATPLAPDMEESISVK